VGGLLKLHQYSKSIAGPDILDELLLHRDNGGACKAIVGCLLVTVEKHVE
jgi:hypothetical protein